MEDEEHQPLFGGLSAGTNSLSRLNPHPLSCAFASKGVTLAWSTRLTLANECGQNDAPVPSLGLETHCVFLYSFLASAIPLGDGAFQPQPQDE